MNELPLWKRPAVRIGAVVLAIPALALAWWLGSPLFLDNEVDEAFPLSATAQVPDDMTQEDVEKEMEEAADADPVVAEEPMPEEVEEPMLLASATFSGADDFHEGSGTASVYELPDGSQLLRFEDFEVTNGPALRVILVPTEGPVTTDTIDEVGYTYVDELKGNSGNQNYEVPSEIDLSSGEYSIVIYCEPFHVVFATATLGE